jgi:hypothetical protein
MSANLGKSDPTPAFSAAQLDAMGDQLRPTETLRQRTF